jgi:hypothetical protein
LTYHDLLTALAHQHGWDVLDAFAVTRSLYVDKVQGMWDALHFLPFVYDQLNDLLLNGLC